MFMLNVILWQKFAVVKTTENKLFSEPSGVPLMLIQGCHVSGKSQGKTKFSPGQGIVREF